MFYPVGPVSSDPDGSVKMFWKVWTSQGLNQDVLDLVFGVCTEPEDTVRPVLNRTDQVTGSVQMQLVRLI